jgi:hypothetical protein
VNAEVGLISPLAFGLTGGPWVTDAVVRQIALHANDVV